MKFINSKFEVVILISVFWFLFSFYRAEAHEAMFFSTSKTSYRVGESFVAPLLIDTEGKSINTVSGTIAVPRNILRIVDVRYGNSIVSLWVKQPQIDYARGTVTFTGGIPGGFNGNSGQILSLGLKAEREGAGALKLRDVQVLLNDGQGTVFSGLEATARSLTVLAAPPPAPTAEEEKPSVVTEEEIFLPDTTPPEEFFPLISRHPSVEGNKYFVSFFAVDKDTGIAHYVIHERPLILTRVTTKWDTTERVERGPYVLKNQFWPTRVVVQAYDQVGNVREPSTDTPIRPLFLTIVGGAALIAGAGIVYIVLRPRYYKRLKHKV